jgi:hypothetical protein
MKVTVEKQGPASGNLTINERDIINRRLYDVDQRYKSIVSLPPGLVSLVCMLQLINQHELVH